MLCTFLFGYFQIHQNKSAKNIAVHFIGTIVPIKCMPKIWDVGLFSLDKFENNQTRTCTTFFRTLKLTEVYFWQNEYVFCLIDFKVEQSGNFSLVRSVTILHFEKLFAFMHYSLPLSFQSTFIHSKHNYLSKNLYQHDPYTQMLAFLNNYIPYFITRLCVFPLVLTQNWEIGKLMKLCYEMG